MQTFQSDYLAAYRSLKMTRDSDGVLVVQFHTAPAGRGRLRPTFTSADLSAPASRERMSVNLCR